MTLKELAISTEKGKRKKVWESSIRHNNIRKRLKVLSDIDEVSAITVVNDGIIACTSENSCCIRFSLNHR